MFSKNTLKSLILILFFISIGMLIFFVSTSKKKYGIACFTNGMDFPDGERAGALFENTMNKIFDGTGYEGCFKIFDGSADIPDSGYLNKCKAFILSGGSGWRENYKPKAKDAMYFFTDDEARRQFSVSGNFAFPVFHENTDVIASLQWYFKLNGVKKAMMVYDDSCASYEGVSSFMEKTGITCKEIRLSSTGSDLKKEVDGYDFGRELTEFSPDCFFLACSEKNAVNLINSAPGYPREKIILISDCNPSEIVYYCGINSIGVKLLSTVRDMDYSGYSQKTLMLEELIALISESYAQGHSTGDAAEKLNNPADFGTLGSFFYEDNRIVSPIYFFQLNPDDLELVFTYDVKRGEGYESSR